MLAAVLAAILRPGEPLDSNKVVVFPLGETPPGASREGTGRGRCLDDRERARVHRAARMD